MMLYPGYHEQYSNFVCLGNFQCPRSILLMADLDDSSHRIVRPWRPERQIVPDRREERTPSNISSVPIARRHRSAELTLGSPGPANASASSRLHPTHGDGSPFRMDKKKAQHIPACKIRKKKYFSQAARNTTSNLLLVRTASQHLTHGQSYVVHVSIALWQGDRPA